MSLRARLSKPADIALTIREYYDDEVRRKVRTGAAFKGVRPSDEPARRGEGPDGLAIRHARSERARCSTSGAASARSCGGSAIGTAPPRPASTSRDLASYPALAGDGVPCGLIYEAPLADRRSISSPCGTSSSTTTTRFEACDGRIGAEAGRTLVVEVPRLDSRPSSLFGHRWPGLQAPQHTVLSIERT